MHRLICVFAFIDSWECTGYSHILHTLADWLESLLFTKYVKQTFCISHIQIVAHPSLSMACQYLIIINDKLLPSDYIML